jgi:hypothetical protein
MSNFSRIAAFFASMVVSLPASAQTQPDFHWCTLNAAAGYSAVTGKDGSNLSGQWDFQAGVGATWEKAKTWNWFLNVDYLYAQAAVKSAALAEAKILNPTDVGLLTATGGTSRFNVVALDLTVRYQTSRSAEIYAFGGFGLFRRQVDLTGVSDQGALLQPGNPSVFLRNSNSGSVDGGGGINFRRKNGWAIPYVEVRVVHGLAVNKTTTLVPLSVGLRF